MKNWHVFLLICGLMLCLSAGVYAQTPRLFLTLEVVDEAGIGAMKDSLEGVGPDTEIFLSVYGDGVSGLIGYQIDIPADITLFKDNEEFIYSRTGDDNPLSSAVLKINQIVEPAVGTAFYTVAVSLPDNATGVNLTDWTFLGRLKLETSSDFKLPDELGGDFAIFAPLKAQFLTNPGLVLSDVSDVNSAFINITTDVDDDDAVIPESYNLGQNYPNPFNPSTKIPFELKSAGDAKITVYNVLGQKVADVVNERLPAGKHTVTFDAVNLSSGIYFYRLEVSDFVQMRRFVLIR